MKKKPPVLYKPSGPPALDPLNLYLREMAKYPLLSPKEEQLLAQKFYNSKDPQAAKILAQANLRFVVKIAMEYTRFGARLIDLIQEGNIGLLQAIKQFNPYKGVRLITYAVWWIRGYMQEYILRQYSLVRIGKTARQKKLFYQLRKEQAELLNLTPMQPEKALPPPSGFKEQQELKHRLNLKDISLDQPASPQSSTRLIDLQFAPNDLNPEEQFNLLEEKQIITEAIKKLKPLLSKKELFILNKRLLCEKPLTLQKIGEKYSVSREYIRQIEARLLDKIKARVQQAVKL